MKELKGLPLLKQYDNDVGGRDRLVCPSYGSQNRLANGGNSNDACSSPPS
jgi:hypothetical protein